MNKQPFYHEIRVTFTATEPLPVDQIVRKLLKRGERPILRDTVEVFMDVDIEAGDPADLM